MTSLNPLLARRWQHAVALLRLVLAAVNSTNRVDVRAVTLRGRASQCFLDGRLPNMPDPWLANDGRDPLSTLYFQWILGKTSNGYTYIQSVSSGHFLTFQGDAARLVSGDSSPENDPRLQWEVTPTCDGFHVLQNVASGVFLDDLPASPPLAGVTTRAPRQWTIEDLPHDKSRELAATQLVWQHVCWIFETFPGNPANSSFEWLRPSELVWLGCAELKQHLAASLQLRGSVDTISRIDAMRQEVLRDPFTAMLAQQHLRWVLQDDPSPHKASPQLKSLVESVATAIYSLGRRVRDGSIAVDELERDLTTAFESIAQARDRDVDMNQRVQTIWRRAENVILPILMPVWGIEHTSATQARARDGLEEARNDAFFGPLIRDSKLLSWMGDNDHPPLTDEFGAVVKTQAMRLLRLRQRVRGNAITVDELEATIDSAFRTLEVFLSFRDDVDEYETDNSSDDDEYDDEANDPFDDDIERIAALRSSADDSDPDTAVQAADPAPLHGDSALADALGVVEDLFQLPPSCSGPEVGTPAPPPVAEARHDPTTFAPGVGVAPIMIDLHHSTAATHFDLRAYGGGYPQPVGYPPPPLHFQAVGPEPASMLLRDPDRTAWAPDPHDAFKASHLPVDFRLPNAPPDNPSGLPPDGSGWPPIIPVTNMDDAGWSPAAPPRGHDHLAHARPPDLPIPRSWFVDPDTMVSDPGESMPPPPGDPDPFHLGATFPPPSLHLGAPLRSITMLDWSMANRPIRPPAKPKSKNALRNERRRQDPEYRARENRKRTERRRRTRLQLQTQTLTESDTQRLLDWIDDWGERGGG